MVKSDTPTMGTFHLSKERESKLFQQAVASRQTHLPLLIEVEHRHEHVQLFGLLGRLNDGR
jgi:hypothetical protein